MVSFGRLLLPVIASLFCAAPVLFVKMDFSMLTPEQQREVRARDVQVRDLWNRNFRLCRCAQCCAEGPSHVRTNFVRKDLPSRHVRRHGLGTTEAKFNHFTADELHLEHFLSLLEAPGTSRAANFSSAGPHRDQLAGPSGVAQPRREGASVLDYSKGFRRSVGACAAHSCDLVW